MWAFIALHLTPSNVDSAEDIKHAFHRVALTTHPDKQTLSPPSAAVSCGEEFQRAHKAYRFLIAHASRVLTVSEGEISLRKCKVTFGERLLANVARSATKKRAAPLWTPEKQHGHVAADAAEIRSAVERRLQQLESTWSGEGEALRKQRNAKMFHGTPRTPVTSKPVSPQGPTHSERSANANKVQHSTSHQQPSLQAHALPARAVETTCLPSSRRAVHFVRCKVKELGLLCDRCEGESRRALMTEESHVRLMLHLFATDLAARHMIQSKEATMRLNLMAVLTAAAPPDTL